MTKETIEDLVKFCGGDIALIDKWREDVENREITTIEELINYPFKEDYCYIVREGVAPKLYDLLMNKLYDGNRYETIDLDEVLERMEYFNYSESEVEEIHQELISLKFGSMEYDW